jgi:hypothetical protein
MSADNYVIVKKFGDKFFYGMFFASDEDPKEDQIYYRYGPFDSPMAAAKAANEDNMILEYGVDFHDNCY